MSSTMIGLIDCNNFFVSCERLFRPDLQGVPVVVLSSNDGCVVARSQEIKDIGIPMGVPYFQIKDTLQQAGAVVFSGHIALYRDISRRVFAAVQHEVLTMEQYSIDEAFFTISNDGTIHDQISRLKHTIERQVGIPVSIGVAASKTQAKYASTVAKKTNGLYVCQSHEWHERASSISLEHIWGVGSGLARKYKQHGLMTVADVLALDRATMARCFGVVGERLQAELSGLVTSPVEPKKPLQKSLMNSRSFSKTTEDKAVLEDAAAYHTRQIAAELRAMGAACTTIRLSIQTSRHGDFFMRGGSKEVVFQAPTADTFVLMETVRGLLVELYELGVPYHKVGVSVAGIVLQTESPVTLFTDERPDANSLLLAMDTLNRAAGKELVMIGSRLQTARWQSKSETRSPAYTTRWSEIATVSA